MRQRAEMKERTCRPASQQRCDGGRLPHAQGAGHNCCGQRKPHFHSLSAAAAVHGPAEFWVMLYPVSYSPY